MASALIQVVDEDDRPVGSASITEARQHGLIHRIVGIIQLVAMLMLAKIGKLQPNAN